MSMTDLLYPSSYVRANTKVRSWFEFLLQPELLADHLKEEDPEPSGCILIKQFFDQANRPVNDQGQILPPPDNERNKAVRSLALQTASLLNWDLNTFDRELPIAVRHQLLTELLKVCNTAIPPAPQNALAGTIEKMHDHSLMSLILYCRWAGKTIVKSTMPVKPGGRITPTVPQSVPYQANAQQRCDEVREQILSILKEQMFDIVQVLEAVLHQVKRAVKMPGQTSVANNQLCSSPSDATGDIVVSCEELHAQICYDLGCLHFTHSFYDKANEMFGHAREWMGRLPKLETSGFCQIDESALTGYRSACRAICKVDVAPGNASDDLDGLYSKVEECLKQNKGTAIREMIDYVIEDVYKKELSTSYLDQIERRILYSEDTSYDSDTLFDLRWSISVRRAARGVAQPTGLWTFGMNLAQLQRVVGMVQLLSPYVNQDESNRLGSFLCSLANNLPDQSLSAQLLQFEIAKKLIGTDDLNALLLRTQDSSKKPEFPAIDTPKTPKPESSSSKSAERKLLRTFVPSEVEACLKKLHSASGGSKKFSNVTSSWELSPGYVTAITASTTKPETYDLFHVLFAKSRHCCKDGDYVTSKKLLQHIQKSCSSKSEQKIHNMAANELLRVELVELLSDKSLNYTDAEECSELRNQLSDVVLRCRHVISTSSDQSKHANLPPDLVELSTAMLLNLEDLSFFLSLSRGPSLPPCVRIAYLLSSVRACLADCKIEPRKGAHELWSAAMGIFASAAPLSGSTSGRGGSKKVQLEPLRNLAPPNAVIGRPALVKFIRLLRNPNLLQIILSLLVHLHRLCRTDILSDITVPDSSVINSLWPGGLDGAPLSGPCVTLALRETLSYCLTLQPQNKTWLRTQADVHHAFSNYGAALRCYLLLGAFATSHFTEIPHSEPYDDDQVIQRMIKCCMHMRCYTQAAVLCQMTKEVDYQTAFKALQESRERTDAAEIHYRDHIWNVQILEHAAFEHRESAESVKKSIAIAAISRPELNRCNAPGVGVRVKALKRSRFLQAMARQYLYAQQ